MLEWPMPICLQNKVNHYVRCQFAKRRRDSQEGDFRATKFNNPPSSQTSITQAVEQTFCKNIGNKSVLTTHLMTSCFSAVETSEGHHKEEGAWVGESLLVIKPVILGSNLWIWQPNRSTVFKPIILGWNLSIRWNLSFRAQTWAQTYVILGWNLSIRWNLSFWA